MTAKFLLSLTKISQIKRARPSTASITQPNSAEVGNLLFIAIRCPSIYRLDYLYFELGRVVTNKRFIKSVNFSIVCSLYDDDNNNNNNNNNKPLGLTTLTSVDEKDRDTWN